MPQNCLYCQNKEALDALMIKIADLEVSTLYLFREQTHPGRCVVAFKDHVGQQFEMNPKKTYLTEKEYASIIEKIKAQL